MTKDYDPNQLFDTLLDTLHLKNDAALARVLDVQPPMISKIRHRRLSVSAGLLLRMHEVTGKSIRELRDLMGDRRASYRFGDLQRRPFMPSPEQGGELSSRR